MRYKKRVTLTIDPEVWARCQQLTEQAGCNWSQVAEECFSKIIEVVDAQLEAHKSGNHEKSLLLLQASYHKTLSDMYTAIDGVQADKPEHVDES
jgi:hypothetical protein